MGDRAVITFNEYDKAPSIYLHWEGSREYVEGFLKAGQLCLQPLKRTNATKLMDDLAHLIAKHYFEGKVGFTVYRQEYAKADKDNWDNGTYIVNEKTLEIVTRKFLPKDYIDTRNEHKSGLIAQHIRESVEAEKMKIIEAIETLNGCQADEEFINALNVIMDKCGVVYDKEQDCLVENRDPDYKV